MVSLPLPPPLRPSAPSAPSGSRSLQFNSLTLASIPIRNPVDLSVTGETIPHAASLWDGFKD
ncbi:MAG: hypothetical protein ACP5D7_12865 [Limnospira sp.]